jgi:glutamate racemase
VATEYLKDLKIEAISVLVLGCTHYPILRRTIADIIGPEVTLIDSGAATATEVAARLEKLRLSHDEDIRRQTDRRLGDDLDHFYVTDAAQRFAKVAERFLGTAPSILEAVEVWGHDELRSD